MWVSRLNEFVMLGINGLSSRWLDLHGGYGHTFLANLQAIIELGEFTVTGGGDNGAVKFLIELGRFDEIATESGFNNFVVWPKFFAASQFG